MTEHRCCGHGRVDWGLLWIRIWAGLGMMWHGGMKIFTGGMAGFTEAVAQMGFPMPALFAWAAALSEFVGGLCLVLGCGTRIAGFLIFITMMVAAWVKHGQDPFKVKELALAYGAVAGLLIITGAGRWSLDHWFCQRKSRHTDSLR